ncbi:MAG: HYR domain-containing protein [Bacteroidota bacterium]
MQKPYTVLLPLLVSLLYFSQILATSTAVMPVATISGNTLLCEGSTQLTAGGGVSFLWSTDETSATISVVDPGVYSVTVTDQEGLSDSTSVTVTVDDEAPVFEFCPSSQVIRANFGESEVSAFWLDPIANDNCSIATLSSDRNSGDLFPLGLTSVEYTATDPTGNSSICEFTIEVIETDELTFYVDTTDFIFNDSTATVYIKTLAFTDIVGFSFTIKLPEGIDNPFQFAVQNALLPPSNGTAGFSLTEIDAQTLVVAYNHPDLTPISLDDGATVITLTLNLPGEIDDCFFIDLNDAAIGVEAIAFSPDPIIIFPTVIGGEICVPRPIEINGRVFRADADNTPVGMAEVSLYNDLFELNEIDITDAAGRYGFTNVARRLDYILRPTRDINPRNGVSVVDLILIQLHLSGDMPFTSPYQWVAADVAPNSVITGVDLTQIRQLILTIIQAFPQSPSWRFIPTDYEFTDPNFPLIDPFPEEVQLDTLRTNQNIDFYAVKMGDVNNTADVASLTEGPSGEIARVVADGPINIEAGQHISIPVRLTEQGNLVAAFQGTWAFDPSVLKLRNIQTENETEWTVIANPKRSDRGLLPLLAHRNEPQKRTASALETPIFTLEFDVLQTAQLSEVFWLKEQSNAWVPSLAASRTGTALPLTFEVHTRPTYTSTAGLAWTSVSPNPFREAIQLTFSAAPQKDCYFEVYDNNGKRLLSQTTQTDEVGQGSIQLRKAELPRAGLYLLQLQVEGSSQVIATRFVRQ